MIFADIDECTWLRGRVCSVYSDCKNTPGSYTCDCKDGFRRGDDDHSCIGMSSFDIYKLRVLLQVQNLLELFLIFQISTSAKLSCTHASIRVSTCGAPTSALATRDTVRRQTKGPALVGLIHQQLYDTLNSTDFMNVGIRHVLLVIICFFTILVHSNSSVAPP